MSMFTLAISCLTHFQFALIHGPNIPHSYAILLFIASDFTFITGHIHNWVLLLLWLHPFILSGVMSPLISSSILDAPQPAWGVHLSVSYLFAFSCCSWGSHSKNMEVVCHSLLQWTTFCLNSGVGLYRKLRAEELMLLNCGVEEDSWESLGLQGDQASQS